MKLFSGHLSPLLIGLSLMAAASRHTEAAGKGDDYGSYYDKEQGLLEGFKLGNLVGGQGKGPVEMGMANLNQLSSGISDWVGGKKGVPLSKGMLDSLSQPIAIAKEFTKDSAKKFEVIDIKHVKEWYKLALTPLELARSVSKHFDLPVNKFLEKVGKKSIAILEIMLKPLVAAVKMTEKMFPPDACRLKLICRMGSRLDFARETVLNFSPNFLEGCSQLQAMEEGIVGRNCETAFRACDSKTAKQYANLMRFGARQLPDDMVMLASDLDVTRTNGSIEVMGANTVAAAKAEATSTGAAPSA